MGLETFDFITSLNRNNPAGADQQAQGDDHIRGVKLAVQDSFPNIDAPVLATPDDLNLLVGGGQALNPVGAIIMFGADSTPDGYLFCDGSAIPVEHVDLIALLASANVPDMRGYFVRGMSTSSAVDPSGPRSALSTQGQDLIAHQHTILTEEENSKNGPNIAGCSRADGDFGGHSENFGGSETRPVNIAVRYCIKF